MPGLAEINQAVFYRELLLSDWKPRLHLNHQHPCANRHCWFSTPQGFLRMSSAIRQIRGQLRRCEFTPLSLQLWCLFFSLSLRNAQTGFMYTYSRRMFCNGLAMVYAYLYVGAFKDFNSSKRLAFPSRPRFQRSPINHAVKLKGRTGKLTTTTPQEKTEVKWRKWRYARASGIIDWRRGPGGNTGKKCIL